MQVAARRVGLPDLDQGVGRPAVLVQNATRHTISLPKRFARALAREIVVGFADRVRPGREAPVRGRARAGRNRIAGREGARRTDETYAGYCREAAHRVGDADSAGCVANPSGCDRQGATGKAQRNTTPSGVSIFRGASGCTRRYLRPLPSPLPSCSGEFRPAAHRLRNGGGDPTPRASKEGTAVRGTERATWSDALEEPVPLHLQAESRAVPRHRTRRVEARPSSTSLAANHPGNPDSRRCAAGLRRQRVKVLPPRCAYTMHAPPSLSNRSWLASEDEIAKSSRRRA